MDRKLALLCKFALEMRANKKVSISAGTGGEETRARASFGKHGRAAGFFVSSRNDVVVPSVPSARYEIWASAVGALPLAANTCARQHSLPRPAGVISNSQTKKSSDSRKKTPQKNN